MVSSDEEEEEEGEEGAKGTKATLKPTGGFVWDTAQLKNDPSSSEEEEEEEDELGKVCYGVGGIHVMWEGHM